MPRFANCTTLCAYLDTSTKGRRTNKAGEKARHQCYRVEKYTNGHGIRLGRVQAASKAEAIAAFS